MYQATMQLPLLSLLCAFFFLQAATAAFLQAATAAPASSTSSQPACSKCTPVIDPQNPGHYVNGSWTPNYINETGLWVPNSDPAEKNGFCLDCNVTYKDGDYQGACREAGCPVPPPSPYATCTDSTTKEDCKVCDKAWEGLRWQ
jgi:hypothetical protein